MKLIVTDNLSQLYLTLWCPGCYSAHMVRIGVNGWGWNEDREKPTITPSILVHAVTHLDGTVYLPRCHSFVTDGAWRFLEDSGHYMAGETVDICEFPKNYRYAV